ncbi:cationic amino acid transporter 4-like [Choloepus didactylus]|uniref:cationic amino acid transporter 4-like n=1 Tax=Choloepus didactylus TaxID=27675 RepID=UPI00189DD472|nr:cationic amino acid transporter 4-like [Choloepus didactylus]
MARGLPSAASLVRFCQKVNRVRPLEETTMETSLHRCLSMLDLTLLGVGGMVGVGLYVLTGTVAKELAGPAVIVSYAVAAVASLLAALCYMEFWARVPRTGSAYRCTYVSMGELWAFLIGWNTLLEYLIGGATVAWAWSGYLDAMVGHHIRNFIETYLGVWQVPFLAHYPDFLAATILLLATIFISCGARVSFWLNRILSPISLGVILLIIILGFILARPENWSSQEGGFAPFGFSGILAGTATCFYAFTGFDVITTYSEEARNPQRAVPKAIAFSLALAATAYILVSTVLTLMVPWPSLEPYAALVDAFNLRDYTWAGGIVAAGSVSAMATVLVSNLFSLPRITYAMAVDGLLFQVFARVHPHTRVPVVAMLVFWFLMATLALLLDLEALVQFLSITSLLTYTFVAASVIVLRFRKASPPSSFSGHVQPVDDAQAMAPEPGRLRPALRPYLGFLDSCGHGTTVAWALGLLVASAVTLGCVLNFGDSVLHLPRWGYIFLLLSSGVVFLLSLAILGAHQQQHRQDIFQVPLVPLTPALSILLNICLVLQLSLLTWLCFCIWLLIGLTLYFGYGIRHSKLNLRESSGRDSQVETEQEMQPLSRLPAQEPGHTEQPIRQ